MTKKTKKPAGPELLHIRCQEPNCKDLHWVCSCYEWQGSRILNDRANRKEWRWHALNECALTAALVADD